MDNTFSQAFRPSWWLRSPHLQTLWATLFRRLPSIRTDWERLELTDGDFIDLAWLRHPSPAAPLVLMMHGLEGSLKSHYAPTLMTALQAAGFSVVFMHLRGCGRDPNRLPRTYHSGASEDLAEVLQQLQARGQRPAAAIGISLSANLLLKYLGESGTASGLQAAVAVSPPFRLAACAQRLERGFSRLYAGHLLKSLKASYLEKFSRMPSPLQIEPDHLNTLYQFDEHITGPLNGFTGADDYYQRCSCAPLLPAIRTPTLIIHAADDPFMLPDIVPAPHEVSAAVRLEVSAHGGHVGFVGGTFPWKASYWLDERIPAYLRACLLPDSAR